MLTKVIKLLQASTLEAKKYVNDRLISMWVGFDSLIHNL